MNSDHRIPYRGTVDGTAMRVLAAALGLVVLLVTGGCGGGSDTGGGGGGPVAASVSANVSGGDEDFS